MPLDHQNESQGKMTASSTADIGKLMSTMDSLGVDLQQDPALTPLHAQLPCAEALMASTGAGAPAPSHCVPLILLNRADLLRCNCLHAEEAVRCRERKVQELQQKAHAAHACALAAQDNLRSCATELTCAQELLSVKQESLRILRDKRLQLTEELTVLRKAEAETRKELNCCRSDLNLESWLGLSH